MNWTYRYYQDSNYDLLAIGGGIVETSVGIVGLCVLIIRLMNKCNAYRSKNVVPSIYILPSVQEQFQSDNQILINENGTKSVKNIVFV